MSLDCPAYKLLISDLAKATLVMGNQHDATCSNDDDDDKATLLPCWQLTLSPSDLNLVNTFVKTEVTESSSLDCPQLSDDADIDEKTIDLALVWIQGTITNNWNTVNNRDDFVKVNDDTGECIVEDFPLVPGGSKKNIKKGSYVGIIASILAVDPVVKLKAVKVMNLSGHLLKSMWKNEVKFLKMFLLDLIRPEREACSQDEEIVDESSTNAAGYFH